MLIAKQYVIPTIAAGGLAMSSGGKYMVVLAASENVNINVFRRSVLISDVEGVGAGLRLGPYSEGYDSWTVETVSGNAGTATIAVADEEISYDVISGAITLLGQPIATTKTPGANLNSFVDLPVAAGAAAVVALAANANRKTAIIEVKTGSAGVVRIGDVNTAAARGVELQVGQSISLDCSAAVYVFSAAGATLTLLEVAA